jgi:acetoacetyl-CoA synthetase
VAAVSASHIARFRSWLETTRGLDLPDYQALWTWSVEDLDGFWAAVAEFFGAGVDGAGQVLADARMPGAVWFPGATTNLAREVLAQADDSRPALLVADESGVVETWAWERLRRETAALASWLRAQGVGPGDRVVGYLGNGPHAVVGLLATASLGAIWSVCNQDVSAEGAASRFAQLAPAVLLTASSSSYNGKSVDRHAAVEALVAALPSLRAVLVVGAAPRVTSHTWDALSPVESLTFDDVPFDAPLWVLFSSGTTGSPKGLVHGHGGTLLTQLVALGLHYDVHPGDRFFWYCSTSWVMWNLQVCSLLLGATAVLYDGSPTYPDTGALWRLAAELEVTHLGVSPGLLALAERDDVPGEDLHALRVLGVTGSPLPAGTAAWARRRFGVPLNVISGGTDVATAFVGGNPLEPEPAPGTMGPPWLGVDAVALDACGEPVLGEVGELVVRRPMPSMPLRLWGDTDHARYLETYFADYPGLWRQGDWVTMTPRPGGHLAVEVHGRSDATLNRNGVRIGTAELYAAAEALPEVLETLVVGLELPDGGYWMPMFVQLAEGCVLDDALIGRLRNAIRQGGSARHVPDEFVAVPALPHTLTGKRLEVPVKRILLGHPVDEVVAASAVDRPELLHVFAERELS